jgi:hypothetical protein
MSDKHINLVFHGVFAFVLTKDGIEVLCPSFAPHEYRFGCWGHLRPLGKGHCRLTGLDGVNGVTPVPDFNRNYSPTVGGFDQVNPENLFCAMKLSEYPLAVYHFRLYENPTKGSPFPFCGVHGSKLNLSTLAGPIALSYTTDSFDSVELQYSNMSVDFDAIPEPNPNKDVMNLHFFAEGEHDLPPMTDADFKYQVGIHYQEAWSRLTSLLFSLDVRLKQIAPFVEGGTPTPPADTNVRGLPGSQLLDLDEIYQLSLLKNPTPQQVQGVFGGHTDCDKAHLVIDNRA